MNSTEMLAMILDCGENDISIFDDTRADILETAIENARANGDMYLPSIFYYAFDDAFDTFCKAVLDKKQELIDDITPYAELNDDGEIELPAELEEVCRKYEYGYQTDVENFSLLAQEDIEKLRGLSMEQIHNDFSYYFNYLDTHIYCDYNSDFYSRLFKDELSDFSSDIGFEIENVSY